MSDGPAAASIHMQRPFCVWQYYLHINKTSGGGGERESWLERQETKNRSRLLSGRVSLPLLASRGDSISHTHMRRAGCRGSESQPASRSSISAHYKVESHARGPEDAASVERKKGIRRSLIDRKKLIPREKARSFLRFFTEARARARN